MTMLSVSARIAAAACTVALAGCTTTIPGAAHTLRSGAPSPSSVTAPEGSDSPSNGFIAPNALNATLLKRGDLAAAVASADLRPLLSYDKPDFSTSMQPQQCDFRAFPARSTAYLSPLLEGMAGDANSDDQTGVLAAQVVSSWSTVDHPKMVLSKMTSEWNMCPDGQGFTAFTPEKSTPWLSGPVTQPTEQRAVSLITRQEPPAKTCAHLVTMYLNTVVETLVCGPGDTVAQAGVIADRVVSNLRG